MERVFVIAEIVINHNGNINTAKKVADIILETNSADGCIQALLDQV